MKEKITRVSVLCLEERETYIIEFPLFRGKGDTCKSYRVDRDFASHSTIFH